MKRFLVMHDYGMGACYWWIDAPSPDHLLRHFAEVVIVNDPSTGDFSDTPVAKWDDDELPPGLDDLRQQRREQIARPGFGALVGRGSVYVRQTVIYGEEGELFYLTEYDSDGYRTRQIEIPSGGLAIATTSDDWLFNPPEDLWNPDLAACEISREEFETHWERTLRKES
jgi:hypothetical protein